MLETNKNAIVGLFIVFIKLTVSTQPNLKLNLYLENTVARCLIYKYAH